MLGLGHRPLLVTLCFAGLTSLCDDLLMVWSGKRVAAGECYNCRSNQLNQGAPLQQSANERPPASEKDAASI
jgi:ABC-type uncharacterized transport system ATPase subunit